MLKGGIISAPAVIRFFADDSRMDINRFLGLFSSVFCLLAIAITTIFYKESPVTLIKKGKEDDALKIMLILRGKAEETQEITESLDEIKAMLAEEKQIGAGIFREGNIRPLVVILLLKFAFVLTYNYSLKYIHLTLTQNSKFNYNFVLNLIHTFTVVFVLFTIDKGRRIHFNLSGFGTSLILIVFGALRASTFKDSNFIIFIMFVGFEFLSGLGIGLTAVTYSTEAFYTLKKPGSIAFTGIFESCLQILFVIWAENVIYSNAFDVVLLLFSGIILGLISAFLFTKLPETSNISIRKARNKFI
jgi:Sugar (and other) transporter